MSEVLLTIGIPSFNGEKYIESTIYSALKQILDLNCFKVEIVISDNASTDNTSQIVKSFVEKYPDIVKYFVNDVNLGFDKNVDKLFKLARGKYVEILGDDDFICEGGLKKLINVLNSDVNASVVLLNMNFLDINSNVEYGDFVIERDWIFLSGDDFFQFSKWRTSAISSLVIRRDDWNVLNLKPYFGTQWVHLSAIIEILGQNNLSYVISDRIITVRTGNSMWSNHFGNQLKIGLIHVKVFSKMLDFGYSNDTFSFYLNYRYKTNLKDIFHLAPLNLIQRIEILKLMILLFQKYFLFWVIHIPFLLIFSYPFQVVKYFIKYFYFKLKRFS